MGTKCSLQSRLQVPVCFNIAVLGFPQVLWGPFSVCYCLAVSPSSSSSCSVGSMPWHPQGPGHPPGSLQRQLGNCLQCTADPWDFSTHFLRCSLMGADPDEPTKTRPISHLFFCEQIRATQGSASSDVTPELCSMMGF